MDLRTLLPQPSSTNWRHTLQDIGFHVNWFPMQDSSLSSSFKNFSEKWDFENLMVSSQNSQPPPTSTDIVSLPHGMGKTQRAPSPLTVSSQPQLFWVKALIQLNQENVNLLLGFTRMLDVGHDNQHNWRTMSNWSRTVCETIFSAYKSGDVTLLFNV